jgi:hypothetical protein
MNDKCAAKLKAGLLRGEIPEKKNVNNIKKR